jgi:hypothetical protein
MTSKRRDSKNALVAALRMSSPSGLFLSAMMSPIWYTLAATGAAAMRVVASM